MTKTKFFKNPERGREKFKPYVPQYQVHGLDPKEMASNSVPAVHLTKHAPVVIHDNPRTRPAPTFQRNVPFADVQQQASPIGSGPIPNIGNNIETSWVSVDSDDYDDMIVEEFVEIQPNQTLDRNRPMIDNNMDDEVNYQKIPSKIRTPPKPSVSSYDEQEPEHVVEPNLNIGEDQYLLVINNSILGVGTITEVEEEVRSIIFNENNNIDPDDIIVLKRVKIKIGVFLE